MARVSVIIATYNRAGLLAETLQSVLRQSFQDFEIIVVDDGSSDDTPALMSTFAERAHYLRLEHSGKPGHVRNRGIALARGELIAFVDDDDLWLPHKLKRQVPVLDSDPGLGLVFGDVQLLHADGSTSGPVLSPVQKQSPAWFDLLLAGCFVHPSTVVVRRTLIGRQGMFDESLPTSEDYDCWLRLARTTAAACVPEPLVLVRRHPASQSQASQIVNYRNAVLVLERALHHGPLTQRQRMRAHTTLARWHVHLGRLHGQAGDRATARQHMLRSLRWNPVQRSAWSALVAPAGLPGL